MHCTQGIIGAEFDDPEIVEDAMEMLTKILHVTEVDLESLSGACAGIEAPEERVSHFMAWCKRNDIHTRVTMPGLTETRKGA